MREHFGDRELIDLSQPGAFGVLLPLAPVPARTEQQLAHIRGGGLRASRRSWISWR
jgi:hypothetical protein